MCALALLCAVWLGCLPARADTAPALFASYRGTYNFTGTEATLRARSNAYPCSLVNTGVTGAISNIPAGATITSAQLYWAGSGNTADYNITLDGVPVKATRQYTSTTIGGGYNYFSGAADITAQVTTKRNATYTFGGLSVSTGSPWCDVQAVLGGFAIVVIYSHPNEPFRMLNLYEGFQYFRNTSMTTTLTNFTIPTPLTAAMTARVGHVSWEGDSTTSGSEDVLFNGTALTDSYNPAGNQFNSSSNITGDTSSYGVDFDAYTLKAPYIQAGQTKATLNYSSGADLVLLSAEIIAMPYVAVADLALTMTRTGDLVAGSNASYTLTVTNNGPDSEKGPITIVDTLPAGLKFVSASGSWTCTNSAQSNGQTIVTCTQAGVLASGAKTSALTITVSPNAAGSYTNTATVSGATGDTTPANNTATNTASAAAAAAAGTISAVFTRENCPPNYPVVQDATATGNVCHMFNGPITAADPNVKIYITSVISSGNGQVSYAVSGSDMPVTVDLLASCLPNAGTVTIAYAGKTFDCKGTAQSVTLTLPGNKATASNVAAFSYADVGRVTLTLRYTGYGITVSTSTTFISRPAAIAIKEIVHTQGRLNQGMASPATDIGFTKAGDPFIVRVGAKMADGNWAPSFGREPTALAGVMAAEQIDLDLQLDKFAPNVQDSTVSNAFAVNADFALNSAVTPGGFLDANVSWFEAGYLSLVPYLSDYLGTGGYNVPATAADGSIVHAPALATIVGRFYPDHFATEADEKFACLAAMNCPTTYPVSGGTYSKQPFTVTVTPYGLPRGGKDTPLSLFQNAASTTNRTALVLQAVAAPVQQAAGAATPATLSGFAIDPAKPLPATIDDTNKTYAATASYVLPNPYLATNRLAANWGAPLAIYMRASMNDSYKIGTTVTSVPVSSSSPAGSQYEDGLMVVNGRLQVPNVFGSELLRLNVPLTAQYWTGSAWAVNANDNASTVTATITPAACTKALAQTGTTCKTGTTAGAVNLANAGTTIPLNSGKATVTLLAPGRPYTGSIDYTFAPGAAPVWLPSTQGRAVFGLYKSPVVYLREVY